LKRRELLTTGLLAASSAALLPVTFASTSKNPKGRLVLVILRGALDGLAAVPPYADPDYPALRRDLAFHAPGTEGGVLPLNGLFGLHPAFTFLHEAYTARELIVFHAVASPYRDRSHFDGQDVLESGYLKPHTSQTGWLNRALAAVPDHPPKEGAGVALGQNIPLVMRGPAEVSSWSPSKLALNDDTLERLTDLYASDPLLSARLAEALAADAMARTDSGAQDMREPAGSMERSANGQKAGDTTAANTPSALANQAANDANRAKRYREIVRAAASFLRREDGPQVAVFDTTGWDTHANEGGAQGQLANRLGVLDEGLRTLKAEMGPSWANTAVLLVTEFGRTAAINGTHGTDHGTATAAWLLGGAVHGGRVIADWPGLSRASLYEGRDVKPTLDLRAVMKGVLNEHLLVPERALSSSVFPDSGSVRPLRGLVRT
jgi:uncharacterized protein (DUF1501 family)